MVGVVKHVWTLAWRLRSKELQMQKSFGDGKLGILKRSHDPARLIAALSRSKYCTLYVSISRSCLTTETLTSFE